MLFKNLPTLRWRHNGRDDVSNHQPHDCLLNRLFRRRSKKPSKLRVTGLCAGNSPETGEFPAQMASNAENVSIWWRHHGVFSIYRLNLSLRISRKAAHSLHREGDLWGVTRECKVWPKFYHCHDDVIKRKHFRRNWPFVRGIHRFRWIPHTKASDAALRCFLWSASE